MPRGHYERKPKDYDHKGKRMLRAHKRAMQNPTDAEEVYDIAKGGFTSLVAANEHITELKDKIAMLNQEITIATKDIQDNNKLIAQMSRTIDALLTAVES